MATTVQTMRSSWSARHSKSSVIQTRRRNTTNSVETQMLDSIPQQRQAVEVVSAAALDSLEEAEVDSKKK
jgi:hypothetical protein